MKVLHYYPIALAGDAGTASAVRGWCSALAKAGADVTLAVDADAVALPCPEGVRCVALGHKGRGRFRLPQDLPPALADHDILVTHGGWTPQSVTAGRAAARHRLPYVVTPHGAYHPQVLRRRAVWKRGWNRWIERPHLRQALAAHVFFDDERAHLDGLGVRPPAIVAPNGIDRPAGLCWDGGSGGYLAWLGRFDPVNKGLDLLLHGLALLPERDRPVLRLHGPDPHGRRAALARLAASLGVERWVRLGEPLYGDEKWRFLAHAAGFAFPSRFEAFGLAVGEAVALGVPSLVTAFPLGRLLAAHGGAVEAGWTAESVAAGLTVLGSPGAAAVGRRGAELVARRLRWPTVARAWLRQAEQLLRSTRPVLAADAAAGPSRADNGP